jgi:superfamily II RNA helicase
VTKKVNSEVVKLKTSQLLQMAGRAGRRGKDVEGTVVLMRSKFEDAKVGHKILTSNIDGIRSNFKISYGLAVKLLETKTLKECRDLLERGFGSYLLQMRNLNKNSDNELVSLDDYRLTLRKYTLQGARDYLKLKRRLEKEVRSMEFQLEKMTESDEDLVLAIADYMPLGIGLQLKSGDLGFFLGDVRWGNNNANSGFGIILTDGDTLQIVNKEHIKAFAETEESIPIGVAQDLLDLVGKVPLWEETKISGLKRPALTGRFDKRSLAEESKLSQAVDVVKASRLQVSMKEPGSLTKQRMIIEELEAELTLSPIERAGAGDAVLQALRHAVAQKDPIAFVNSAVKETQSPVTFAWRMFNSVMALLQEFEALNGTVATDLGQTVGSLTGDNELWLALVLQRPSVIALNATELAAVLCGVITDGFKATNAYFRQRPSERVRDTFDELEQLSFELKAAQSEAGVEFPVNLCRETGGMIEQWASGVSWRELCKDTSLDQGDVCRILRRTVEILRQIPLAYGISPAVGQKAYEAANLMDRFPVADFDPNVDSKERTGVGFGGTGEGAEDISDEGIQFEEDSDFEDDARQEARNKETSSLLDALEVLDYDVDDIISGLELNNLN